MNYKYFVSYYIVSLTDHPYYESEIIYIKKHTASLQSNDLRKIEEEKSSFTKKYNIINLIPLCSELDEKIRNTI